MSAVRLLALARADPLILVNLYSDDENLGDVLINRLLVLELRKYGAVVFPTKSLSTAARDRLGLEEAQVWRIPDRRFKLLLAALLLLRGLAGRKTFRFLQPGHFYRTEPQSFRRITYLKRLLPTLLYHGLGLRNCRVGLSVGPLSELEERIEVALRPYFHCYSARERYSLSYLRNLGIPGVSFCPDMAWLLTPDPVGTRARPLAVISFRQSLLGSEDGAYEASDGYLRYILAIARHLENALGLGIAVAYQVERDEAFSHAISRFLSGNGVRIVECRRIESEGEARALYQKASVVVSNRLHALLLGFSAGAAPLAVVSREHSKIIGVLEEAGLRHAIVPFDEDIAPDAKPWPSILQAALASSGQSEETFRRNRRRIEEVLHAIFHSEPPAVNARKR